MPEAISCSHCGGDIPHSHLKAGYVRSGKDGLVCIHCLSSERANVWTVPEQTIDLRKAVWALTGLSLGVLSLWFMQQPGFGSLGIGLMLLAGSGALLLYKVAGAELL